MCWLVTAVNVPEPTAFKTDLRFARGFGSRRAAIRLSLGAAVWRGRERTERPAPFGLLMSGGAALTSRGLFKARPQP